MPARRDAQGRFIAGSGGGAAKPKFVRGDVRAVVARLTDALEANMKVACVYIESKVVGKLQRGQPTVSVKPRPNSKQKQPYRVGLEPSLPDEPPKKVTGRLADSITHAVKRSPVQIVGRVGSNVEYARRLELGFVGTDSAGRSVNQQPRPYLRNTVVENAKQVIKILQKGKL